MLERVRGATMEIPPEEELRLLQSQQRASRAQQPAFQQRAAIVGATVVVGLVIYLTVTVQDAHARSIFEFVLLLFCIPLEVALLLSLSADEPGQGCAGEAVRLPFHAESDDSGVCAGAGSVVGARW